MNIISFFSYKGGVGRTTLLANVGAYMASKGKRVACLDLDINAPGLDIVFEVQKELPQTSMVDFILKGRNLPPAQMCIKIGGTQRWGTDGVVFVFPFPRGSNQKVVEFGNAMKKFLDTFLDTLGEELDVDNILIDTRSGFSREAGPVWLVSNRVCLVTRCSYQHIEGTQAMLKFFEELNASRPSNMIKPLVIVNDVPGDMPDKRNRYIKDKCRELCAIKLMENRELRWRDRVIIFDKQFDDAIARRQHLDFERKCKEITERLLENE